MSITLHPNAMVADIAVIDGVEWVAAQVGKDADCHLVIWRDRQVWKDVKLADGSLAFPKISATGWIGYRDGFSVQHLNLQTGEPITRAEGDIRGNDPIAVLENDIAWQQGEGYDVWRSRENVAFFERVRASHGTGLSRMLPDRVTLVDEDRLFQTPLGTRTRPSWASDGTVALEGADTGVDVWSADLTRHTRILDGQECVTPRIAKSADGYRVCTWGREGLRVETVTDLPLYVPAPAEVWVDAEPVVEDIWPYLVGDDSAWPRTDANGSRMDRIVTAAGADRSVQYVKFGNPTKWERHVRLGVEYIYHWEDHVNDARGECYHFDDGRWLKQRMTVGERIECPQNQIQWWRDGKWTAWASFPYAMILVAHEVEVHSGRKRIRYDYDPGGSRDTIEHYIAELGIGWTEWHEQSQKTGLITSGSEWRVPLNAPPLQPSPGRVTWPPVVSVPPVPTPEPHMPEIQFPPRDETLKALQQIADFFRDRPIGYAKDVQDLTIDREGIAVWVADGYQRRRINGMGHDAAIVDVKRDIERAAGFP